MSLRKRILVYSTQFMPTGGIESHLQEFCSQMAEAGVEMDFVILNSRMLPETKALFTAACRRVYFADSKSSSTRFLYLLWVSMRLIFCKYTSLYTNGQGESVRFFAKMLRYCNWVHHHHTSGDAADQATWGQQYRKALILADTIIACSKTNAHSMQEALHRPVEVIPCFSRKIILQQKVSEQSDWTTNKIKLGYYGRLIPEKGIDTICRLSQESALDFVEFHIWGEGEAYPPAFFDAYPTVIYHGSFSGKAALGKVLGSIDGFILLSVHPEGLPISLLEVMSAGLPWLATDKGGVPDIAVDPISTRVISAQLDYDAIKMAITHFATDIRSGIVSRTAQLELYEEAFSARALVNKWKNVLQLQNIN